MSSANGQTNWSPVVGPSGSPASSVSSCSLARLGGGSFSDDDAQPPSKCSDAHSTERHSAWADRSRVLSHLSHQQCKSNFRGGSASSHEPPTHWNTSDVCVGNLNRNANFPSLGRSECQSRPATQYVSAWGGRIRTQSKSSIHAGSCSAPPPNSSELQSSGLATSEGTHLDHCVENIGVAYTSPPAIDVLSQLPFPSTGVLPSWLNSSAGGLAEVVFSEPDSFCSHSQKHAVQPCFVHQFLPGKSISGHKSAQTVDGASDRDGFLSSVDGVLDDITQSKTGTLHKLTHAMQADGPSPYKYHFLSALHFLRCSNNGIRCHPYAEQLDQSHCIQQSAAIQLDIPRMKDGIANALSDSLSKVIPASICGTPRSILGEAPPSTGSEILALPSPSCRSGGPLSESGSILGSPPSNLQRYDVLSNSHGFLPSGMSLSECFIKFAIVLDLQPAENDVHFSSHVAAATLVDFIFVKKFGFHVDSYDWKKFSSSFNEIKHIVGSIVSVPVQTSQ